MVTTPHTRKKPTTDAQRRMAFNWHLKHALLSSPKAIQCANRSSHLITTGAAGRVPSVRGLCDSVRMLRVRGRLATRDCVNQAGPSWGCHLWISQAVNYDDEH